MKDHFPPPEQAGIDLPEEFIRHFHDKTKHIRKTPDEEDKSKKTFAQELPLFKTEINNFKALTQEQVKEMFICHQINVVNWIQCQHG